ncbi:MAG: class IIb bacteriocin, lactobin A/cerein 7B family, partial [Sphingomonadales bacterium]|nr:class IIb bacteriocin, lactobin A/cerein 7B family [Sphingomonadales bacterium]
GGGGGAYRALEPQFSGSVRKLIGECMSYMDQKVAFAHAGGIQEMNFNEIDEVDGGLAPLAIAAIVVVAVVVVSFGAGVITGYYTNLK